jgi:hypothetical protein
MRTLRVGWLDLEIACESRGMEISHYLDLDTGEVISVPGDVRSELQRILANGAPEEEVDKQIAAADLAEWIKAALRDAWRVEQNPGDRIVPIPEPETHGDMRDMEDFIATVADERLRGRLEDAVRGRGAFRRFRELLQDRFREKERWFAFKEERQRERMEQWLSTLGVQVEWVMPKPPATAPIRMPPRQHLLVGVLAFVRTASQLAGVKRVALLGSLTTEEAEPKDADVLVTVSDDMDLAPLAKAGRRLAGHGQQISRGADLFLADERGDYIGRACHWRDCGPGIRTSCDAEHCGLRHYLHDDFRAVRLKRELVAAPPIELWPVIVARVPVPADVETVLLAPLRAERPPPRATEGTSADSQ